MEPKFHDATELELNQAVLEAKLAFQANRKRSAHERAELLDAIAHQIEELGDALVTGSCRKRAFPKGVSAASGAGRWGSSDCLPPFSGKAHGFRRGSTQRSPTGLQFRSRTSATC